VSVSASISVSVSVSVCVSVSVSVSGNMDPEYTECRSELNLAQIWIKYESNLDLELDIEF